MGPVLSGPSFSEILPLVSGKGSPGLIMLGRPLLMYLSVMEAFTDCVLGQHDGGVSLVLRLMEARGVSSAGFFWGASVTTTSL